MFGRKLSPLKYAEVIAALQSLGFVMKPKTGTAHEQWIRKTETTKHVVTVDKHLAPFSRDLIKSMARQAGLDPRKFHALCKGHCTLEDLGFGTAE
ncbi:MULTISPECIES: type II toxin-antitoxin system HicA family toxin [Enterobacter]|uniref:type II toxin-antitoxin system HicA family toxin n=1 Tax=Enterobacter TaxID=547 RepID=UPI00159473D2|nr:MULTISPECIES: type II toxin-antitoxin system HicA family toxin [Enterobacter]EKS7194934.1 type II toxin-antitoxin system HicA family toxin [Enterobacter ludwigii]MBT1941974.1 type II toxin-antitoxin system HicA family toxin [Enterobacter hormaechei subsp. xiangfangensis]EKS7209362.1 type II toxin-antitoxin system HicA family toxin [Enterobacter ludwigii]MCK6892156.1 type II toxin-antitoxin system HicA family toxin [Enterobacter kobei]MCK7035285.1 type II toxin-antitoxin system HicA family t